MRVAQTNVQLYNQLRERGLPLEDLALVHRAYELLTTLYPAHFQADGKPFGSHGVGVASILAELDQPAEILAVGLLHNVYGNADFGDGRGAGATASRRRVVRDAMGERIEQLVARFPEVRIRPGAIAEARKALPARDDAERRLLLVDLADHLEKYVDLGVLYYGRNDWVLAATDHVGDELIEIASELGQPRLGEMLSSAFAAVESERREVPLELRPSDGRQYLKLVVPRSCRRRLAVRLAEGRRRARSWLRRQTPVRAVFRAMHRRGRG